MDLDYRKQWDQYVKGEWYTLKKIMRKSKLFLFILVERNRCDFYCVVPVFKFWHRSFLNVGDEIYLALSCTCS
jgi:hypothetical protein